MTLCRHIVAIALATGLAIGLLATPAAARKISLIRDAEIERTLKRMSAPILQAAGLAPSTVNIYIINDRSLNAFVAGGRNIFLNTGLLMELETPEELLGVIAHEAGHLAGGHQARRAIALRNARGPALLGLLVGIAAGALVKPDAGPAVIGASQGALYRALLQNSRTEEGSADQAAIAYLARARVDPGGLMRVMELFRGQEILSVGRVDPYVQTHPLSTERMRLLERRIAELAGRSWPEDAERDYWHGRMRAKLIGYLGEPTRVLGGLEGERETELTLYRKALALSQSVDPAAIHAIDRLIALRSSDPYYIELKADILLDLGRAEEAIPLYRRAVRLAKDEPLLKAGLGRALLQLDQPELNTEALRVLTEARAADLADAVALYNLAVAYQRAGNSGMAALAAAERYALTGRTDDALHQARRAAAQLPNGSPGWLRAQDILKLDRGDD